MKTQIDGNVFDVKWKHDIKKKRTSCFIKSTGAGLFFEGSSRCHSREQYDKQIGRKKSMADALLSSNKFNSDSRKKFWNSYEEEIGL